MNTLNFITAANFLKLLEKLSGAFRIFSPVKTKNDYFWQEYRGDFKLSEYRTVSSMRQFLNTCVEPVGTYFEPTGNNPKPFCIVGAKTCDLSNSLKVLDYVFLDGDIDENYKAMRERNLIISSDCTAFKKTCFCLALNLKPYPEELFDLNISPVSDGYVVEIGSEKGKKIITENKSFFEDVDSLMLTGQKQKRKQTIESLLCQINELNFPKSEALYALMKHGYNDPMWAEESLRCVECGSCIMNCPTCHCFLLFDTNDKNGYSKARTWDGCQYKNFTRVAGGASALRFREHRLRNRYIKKFEFFPDRISSYACTGCGRCIEGCPAKIDLRKIFTNLASKQENKA